MEGMLADLTRMLGGGLRGGGKRDPLEEAQALMYEAWDATGPRRVALARQALRLSPDCADAYVLLAEETARSLGEARDLCAQGVAAGERALPGTLSSVPIREPERRFWVITMRAAS